MRISRRPFRTVLGLGGVTAALALVAIAGPAASAAQAAQGTLTLTRIHCNATEDNFGGDDIYIEVDGVRVYGPNRINDGESLDIGKGVPFDGSVQVKVFDEDSPDSDDLLGEKTVTSGSPNPAKFDNDEADYDLFYTIT